MNAKGRVCLGRTAPSCLGQAFFRQFEDRFGLMAFDARKPRNEIVHTGTVLQILKQRLHGYAGTFKNPSATDHIRMAFDFGALVPIEHDFLYSPETDE